MVIEIHDHLVGGRCARRFAVGDVVECDCRSRQFRRQLRYSFAGVVGQLVSGAAGSGVQCPGLLKATGHRPQSMANRSSPITLGGKAFRGGAMLGGAELTGIEQLIVTIVTGSYGAPCDADSDHYRDGQQGEQHADGEPPAWYGRALFQQAVEQLVDPFLEPLRHRAFGIDRFVEFALRSLMRGIAVDVDCGHPRLVLTPAASARGSRWMRSPW